MDVYHLSEILKFIPLQSTIDPGDHLQATATGLQPVTMLSPISNCCKIASHDNFTDQKATEGLQIVPYYSIGIHMLLTPPNS